MVVRFFEIHVLPPLAASPGPYILCTRHRRQSRVRLRLGGTPVRPRSPRYTASSDLRRLQARDVAPAQGRTGEPTRIRTILSQVRSQIYRHLKLSRLVLSEKPVLSYPHRRKYICYAVSGRLEDIHILYHALVYNYA